MDHYLLTARSVTQAQQMAAILERSGIFARVRRIGAGMSKGGCAYSLEVAKRHYPKALAALAEAGKRPVKAFFVSDGVRREVTQ